MLCAASVPKITVSSSFASVPLQSTLVVIVGVKNELVLKTSYCNVRCKLITMLAVRDTYM